MKVSAVSLKNVLGLDAYRIAPGAITRVLGANSVGKSTILKGIMAALQGGDMASVQRINQETGEPIGEAEVKLELDEGLFRIERAGADTTVFERVNNSRGEKKTPRPSSFVAGIYDRELSNPLRFVLETSAAKRLDWLLQVLPLSITPEQVQEAVGAELWPLVEKEASEGHPLQVLTAVRKRIFEARTGINVTRDDKEATYRQIELSIPARMPEATEGGVGGLEARRDEVAARVQAAKAAADHILKAHNTAARAAYDLAVMAARTDGEATIGAIEQSRDAAIAELRAEFDRKVAHVKADSQDLVDRTKRHVVVLQDAEQQKLAAAQADAENERQAAITAIIADEQTLSVLTGDLERARGQVETNAKLQTQIEMVEKFKDEVESLKGKSERYTAGLAAVDKLKGQLLAALPIPGLSVDGKDILVNNINVESINTAAQIAFAVKVAALRAKQRALPVLFIDGAEALDQKNLDALEAAIVAEGVQAFIAIRTEGPLVVETRE